MSDLRFKRTDMMVRLNFLELLKKFPFDKISVSRLAETSMINRTTFYAHYDNTYQLAEKIIDEHIDYINQILQGSITQHKNNIKFNNYVFFTDELFNYLMSHHNEIQLIRQLNFGINSFDSKLRGLFVKTYTKALSLQSDDFTRFIFTNLAMSNFDFIMKKKQVPSKEELKNGLKRLIAYLS